MLEQTVDDDTPALARITATLAAGGYLEALTRELVREAREEGRSWDELGEVFGSSALNVKSRFGSYREYDD